MWLARSLIYTRSMHRLRSLQDLFEQNHSLGLYCVSCNRWGQADLGELIRLGKGARVVTETRFRCKDCGAIVDKQVRPPVPVLGGSVAYLHL